MQERAIKKATVFSAILWLVTGICIGIAILFTSDLDRLLDESLSSFAIGYGLYMLMVVLVLFCRSSSMRPGIWCSDWQAATASSPSVFPGWS